MAATSLVGENEEEVDEVPLVFMLCCGVGEEPSGGKLDARFYQQKSNSDVDR